MPAMSPFEPAFCRSAPWRLFARRLVLPWALQGIRPRGRVLEIGAGSGAMAAELLAMFDDITMCVTDFDDAMVTAAAERLAPFGDRVECRLTGLALDGVEIRVGLRGFVARFRAVASAAVTRDEPHPHL